MSDEKKKTFKDFLKNPEIKVSVGFNDVALLCAGLIIGFVIGHNHHDVKVVIVK